MSNELMSNEYMNQMMQMMRSNAESVNGLIAVVGGIPEIRTQISEIRKDVDSIRDKSEITEDQVVMLKSLIDLRVVRIVKEYDLPYKMIARLVYQDIYRSLKRNFGIATYRRLKVKYFDDAMELVRNHKSTETLSSRILEKLEEVN